MQEHPNSQGDAGRSVSGMIYSRVLLITPHQGFHVRGNNTRTFVSTNTVKKIYRIKDLNIWNLRFFNLTYGGSGELSTIVCDIIARPFARKLAQKLSCITTGYFITTHQIYSTMIYQIRFTIVYLVRSSNLNLSFLFNPCPGLFSPMSESRGASSKLSSTYFFRFLLYIYWNFSKEYQTGRYGIYRRWRYNRCISLKHLLRINVSGR